MLVLTRRIGEEIIIDGHIRVTITAIKGDKVRVGISAPPHVLVDREEVHRRRREFAEPDVIARPRQEV
jgi:carbon storage regulator